MIWQRFNKLSAAKRAGFLFCQGVACAAGVLLNGCNRIGPAPPDVPPFQHFVQQYVGINSMYGELYTETDLSGAYVDRIRIALRPYKDREAVQKDVLPKEQADALARQFGDTNYNGRYPTTVPMLYVQTLSVDIVSDGDYDAEHPAGSLLNDIFEISYCCADGILSPPYNFERTEQQTKLALSPAYFQTSVAELNQRKPVLFGCEFALLSTKKPMPGTSHRFTVTYKNVEGVVLRVTVPANGRMWY